MAYQKVKKRKTALVNADLWEDQVKAMQEITNETGLSRAFMLREGADLMIKKYGKKQDAKA